MKPNLFSISMFNSEPLKERDTLLKLLNIFEEDKRNPTKWGYDERVRLDYDKDEVIERATSDKHDFSYIYLWRNKDVKYMGHFNLELSSRAFLDFEFGKSMPQKYWQEFFEISHEIAEVVKPRIGIAHIFLPPTIPWKNDKERIQRYMNTCSQPTPVRLIEHGPMGVGMRTYFSGDIMELFGREFLLNAPAVVSELAWGGICIDLVDKPWEANISEILESWINVMNYLESAKVFAIPKFCKDCIGITFSKNIAWANRNN